MKKNVTIGSIAAAAFAVLSTMPVAAQASDGTISFSGNVAGTTCSISVDGQTNIATVGLPAVQSGSLASAGATAGDRVFNVALTQCTGGAGSARAFFEMGPNVDPSTHNLKNTTAGSGGATNVQIQLAYAAGSAIVIGDASQRAEAAQKTPIVDGSATMQYRARYYATGAATPGAVTSAVTYSLDYI